MVEDRKSRRDGPENYLQAARPDSGLPLAPPSFSVFLLSFFSQRMQTAPKKEGKVKRAVWFAGTVRYFRMMMRMQRLRHSSRS